MRLSATNGVQAGRPLKSRTRAQTWPAGAFTTDDCRGDFRAFSSRGVQFIQEPQQRPYGIEAIFRDDDGNWYSLTQPHATLDESADWPT